MPGFERNGEAAVVRRPVIDYISIRRTIGWLKT